MEIKDEYGLPVAYLDLEEALDRKWWALRGKVDVLRVVDPPRASWPLLTDAGFFPKPTWLTWMAGTGGSEEEFLATMPRKERQSIAAARRRARHAGTTFDVRTIDEGFFEVFLKLYEQRVAEMRHGWSVARGQRDNVLAKRENFYAVCAWNGGELVGSCMTEVQPEGDLARIRFSAVDPPGRNASLARVLYLEAIAEARARGVGTVSLGNDPNLYGHIVEPGLLRFKARLGFVPKPSMAVYPYRGDHNADRLLGFNGLSDPSLLLAYVPSNVSTTDDAELRLEVFTAKEELNPASYGTNLGCKVRTHVIP